MAELSYRYFCAACDKAYRTDPGICAMCGGSTFVTESGRTAAHDAASIVSNEPSSDTDLRCVNPTCGQPVAHDASNCDYCGVPTAVQHASGGAPVTCVVLLAPDGTTIPLQEGRRVVLGRHPDHSQWARLAEGNLKVSGRHAEIVVSDGNIHVRDLRSTNGTWVEGIRIDGAASLPIKDGLRIGLSRHLELILHMTDESSPIWPGGTP